MSIITAVSCAVAILGSGTRGCRTLKGYVNRRFLLEKGYKFDKNLDTLDDETVSELIQRGVLIPLPQDLGSEAVNVDPVYETITGMDIPVSRPIYGWRIRFAGDKCLGAALASYSNKAWDLLEVDENGHLNAVETADGFIKGFSTNLVQYEGMTGNDGSVGSKHTLRIQLTKQGSIEYDTKWATIASDEVDWSALQGVDEILLEKTTDGKLKATFACDNSTPVNGLTTSNLRALDSTGAVVAGFAIVAAGDGLYTVSGLTGPGDFIIHTYDSTLQTRTIVLGNYFYKSNDLKWTA